MFEFIKKCFFTSAAFITLNFLNVNFLECFSANSQNSEVRSEIININTNDLVFYPYSIKINKTVVIQSMIHMLKYVFLTKLKTQMYLI